MTFSKGGSKLKKWSFCVPHTALMTFLALGTVIVLILCGQTEIFAENAASTQDKMVVSPTQKVPESVSQSVNQKELINSIETMMDDKLAPLIRMQGNLQKLILEDKFSGPRMTDIVGGIGWILGLFGIAAFFWSFRRKPFK